MPLPSMAVLVSVGPGTPEVRRLRDLVSSLIRYAPRGWLIVIDDNVRARRFPFLRQLSTAWRVVCLPNPHRGTGDGHLGRLTVGVLTGLEWAWRNTSCDFVLKLDTDALVTGSLDSLHTIAADPRVGVAGTLGRDPDRTAEPFGWEAACVSPVLLARQSHPAATAALAPDIDAALAGGYARLVYCQGGAYLVTRHLLIRMAEQGAFARRHHWLSVPVGEDIVVSMYARAASLSLLDASLPGQPFCSKWQGLAFSPAQLVARGHSLIHSVRKDSRFSEPQIRRLFRHFRESAELLPSRPGRFFLYGSAATQKMARSRRQKAVLVGVHAADTDLARRSEYHNLAAFRERCAPEQALFSVLDAGHALSPEGLQALSAYPALNVILCSRRPLPPAALPAGMNLLPGISNVQALCLSQGFALQCGTIDEALETIEALVRQLKPLRIVLPNNGSRHATPGALRKCLKNIIALRPSPVPSQLMSAIPHLPR